MADPTDDLFEEIDGSTNQALDSQQSLEPVQAEPQEHGEAMEDVQDVAQEPPLVAQFQESSLFIPEERALTPVPAPSVSSQIPPPLMAQSQESSLFVPEERAVTPAPASFTSSVMPPPPITRPTTRQPLSTFAKIRKLHQKIKHDKAAANKPYYPYQAVPDDEAYLEAAQSLGTGHDLGQAVMIDQYEKADQMASMEYQNQKQKYDQIRSMNDGQLSFRETCDWMRIQQAEKARKAKKNRDQQKARDDVDDFDLFPDIHGPSVSHEENEPEDDMTDLDPSALLGGNRRLAMPHKAQKQVSLQEAELKSMRVALDAISDMPTKKRKISDGSQEQTSVSATSSVKSRGKSKGSKSKANVTSSRATGTSGKRVRQSAKSKKATQNAIRQATSLFGADVFRQQASQNAPEAPSFKTRNKGEAMKELIASVPLDSLKSTKTDTAALMKATLDFDGRGSVKADGNGMWLVKGMRTSLKAYQVMGTAFMRRRENAAEEPKGGLLADQMGLGMWLSK
jgi:hypothetical protein